jgi:Colicin immunity protein / pyocin immunity protein
VTRDELVVMVSKIIACEGSEQELDEMILTFAQHVPHPAASSLIFHPARKGATPEEIVEQAISYKPIRLGYDAT